LELSVIEPRNIWESGSEVDEPMDATSLIVTYSPAASEVLVTLALRVALAPPAHESAIWYVKATVVVATVACANTVTVPADRSEPATVRLLLPTVTVGELVHGVLAGVLVE